MTTRPLDFYSDTADEALVKLAQTGSGKAEAAILQRYRLVVKAAASRCSAPSLETDDIVQEGFLGLLSAVCSYDEKKGVPFKSYAGVCISNAIRSALKTEARLKNSPLNSYVPIENTDVVSAGTPPEDILIADENTGKIKAFMTTALSPLERKVLFFRIAGKDYKDIADKLSLSEKSVNNALQRVRSKLRKMLRENDS